ncbi:MAG TPA: hypothetical protein VFW92_00390 [Candidatus Limnocylindrales bacterium]|nr:hypothetical protein [Candidatus Limnocylindrales bacterium]
MAVPTASSPSRTDAWGRALMWAAASLVAYVAAGLVVNLLGAVTEQAAAPWDDALTEGATPILWGLLLVVALPRIGRAILGPLRPAARLTWALVIGGLIVAAGVQIALYGWAVARYSAYDIGALGASSLLPAALIATSLAFLAARMARAEARTLARVALAIALSVSGLILLLNVPGVHDGVRPEGLALAGAMVVATAFVICVGLVAFAVPRPDRHA